jgi:hypothetical protein
MPKALRRTIAIFLSVGSAVVVLALLGFYGTLSSPSTAAPHVALLYVGADDCPPCLAWQRGAGAEFRISSLYQRLDYREIKSPRLFDLLKDEYWPSDLRRHRARLRPGTGAPLWIVLANDEVVFERSGAGYWESGVLPKIEKLLR